MEFLVGEKLMAEVLTQVDMINGVFTLGMVIIEITLGVILMLKSREATGRTLLFMGLSLIFMTSPWLANSINFILIILSLQTLSPELHLGIALFMLPIATFLWMTVITELLFKKRQVLILIGYLAYAIIFDSIIIILLITDYTLLGSFDSPIDAVYSSLVSGLILIMLITVLVTSIWFYMHSRRSEDQVTKLKAKLFLLSTTTFAIASIIDSRLETGLVLLLIIRFLLLTAAIELYWSFLMPDYVKKLFLKSNRITKEE